MRARLALLAAATCLAGAANAATIYPLDRATVLASSPLIGTRKWRKDRWHPYSLSYTITSLFFLANLLGHL